MIRRLIISLSLALASVAPIAGDAATKPSFSIADVSAPESAASVTLTISKSAVASSYSKVTVTTVDGTAKAGVDYQPVSTSITFGNKQMSAAVPVPLILRSGYQGSRAFTARIAVTRNGVVSRSTATVTILETETPPPTPPPPSPTGWIAAPLAPGGYGQIKSCAPGCSWPKYGGFTYAPSIYRIPAIGEVFRLDLNFAFGPDGQRVFTAHPVSGAQEVLYFNEGDLAGVAPAQ